jgi:glyoxylase I family protein
MPKPPYRLLQLDHIVLRVGDVEAMSAFYCNVLGCGIERRQDDIGLLQLRAGSALIDLVAIDGKLGRMGGAAPGVEGRNMDHFCLHGPLLPARGAVRSRAHRDASSGASGAAR